MFLESQDPLDSWTRSSEIRPVSLAGELKFSCCGRAQQASGENFSHVTCQVCQTVYGITLQVALLAPESSRFPPGQTVRVTQELELRAGSSLIKLDPLKTYLTTQDTHGVLNVPPGHQPVIVLVPGDRGLRPLVVVVPDDCLERVGS